MRLVGRVSVGSAGPIPCVRRTSKNSDGYETRQWLSPTHSNCAGTVIGQLFRLFGYSSRRVWRLKFAERTPIYVYQ